MEPEQVPEAVAGNANGDAPAAESDEQLAARRKKQRQEALQRALSTDYGNTTAERVAFHRNVVAHPDQHAYKASVGTNHSNGELLVWACEAYANFSAEYPSVGKALAKARTVRHQLEEQLGKKAGRENTERAAELLAAPDEDDGEPAVVAAAPLRGFDAIRIFTFSDEDGVGWLAAREVFSVLAARPNAPSEALLCSRLLRAWPMLSEAHHRLDCFALPHEYGQGLGRGGRSEARAHEVEPAVLRRQRAAAARDGVRAPRAAEIMEEEEAVAEAAANIQLQPMLSFVGLQLVLDPNVPNSGGWQGTEQAAINELLRHLAARFWASSGLITTVHAPVTVVGVRRTRLELLFDSWQLPGDSELYNYEMHLLGPLAHPHYGVFVRDVAAALMHCFPPARTNKWSDELVRTVLPKVISGLRGPESPLVVRNARGELLLWTWTGCFDELTTVPQRPLAPGESGWARAYNSAAAEAEAERDAATLADEELRGENDPAVEAVRGRTVAAGPPRAFPMLTPRGARFVLAELVTWARSKGTRIEPKVRDFARTYLEHYERAIRQVDDLYQNVAKADSVVIAEQFQS
jgi:hypothetical protein